MTSVARIPDWLAAALLGAALAAIGYVAKLVLQWLGEVRAAHRASTVSLVRLFSLLRVSQASFLAQVDNRNRLHAMITERDPQLASSAVGYERAFAIAYPSMPSEERELHSIIRGTTIYSLRPVNQALLTWLRDDTHFKVWPRKYGPRGELARKLADLEAHLLLWNAKYELWIPENPEHALVYLADEAGHGIGFPLGIDAMVEKVLRPRSLFGG